MPFVSQTVCKRDLLRIGREAVENEERVYVKDKRQKLFMTLDPRQDQKHDIVLPLSIQFFRDNFSACTSLIRRGFVFNLTQKASPKQLIARRHTSFEDPLGDIMDRWINLIAVKAAADHENKMKVVLAAAMAAKGTNDRIQAALQEIAYDIALLASGKTRPGLLSPSDDAG